MVLTGILEQSRSLSLESSANPAAVWQRCGNCVKLKRVARRQIHPGDPREGACGVLTGSGLPVENGLPPLITPRVTRSDTVIAESL